MSAAVVHPTVWGARRRLPAPVGPHRLVFRRLAPFL